MNGGKKHAKESKNVVNDPEEQVERPKRNNRKRNCIIAFVVIVVILAAVLIALWQTGYLLGEADGYGNGSIKIKMTSTSESSTALVKRGFKPSRNTITSSTAYSYAFVDGIKFTIKGVSFLSKKEFKYADFNPVKQLVLGPTSTAAPLKGSLDMQPGTFDATFLYLNKNYDLKAYCQTKNKFVYTTTAGVKAIDLSAMTDTAPSDYDYLRMNPSQFMSQTGDYATVWGLADKTFTNNSIATVIVDTRFIATCYDGTDSSIPIPSGNGPDNSTAVGPFNTYSPGQTTSSYDPTKPAFGIDYLPFFLHAGLPSETDGTKYLAETYLYSCTSGILENAATYMSSKSIGAITLAFDPSSNLIGLQARGMGGMCFESNNFFNITKLNDLQYRIYTGRLAEIPGQDPKATGGLKRKPADKIMANFTRIQGSDYSTVLPILLEDGAGCVDPSNYNAMGHGARACSNNTLLFYIRKVQPAL